MKKKIMMLLISASLCVGMVMSVGAQELQELPQLPEDPAASSEEAGTISTFAAVIENKFRYFNGHYQYRRWNRTYGFWVDPYWINL